jgi:hypothetical protein
MSLVLAGDGEEAFDASLASDLQSATAQAAQVPAKSVHVDIQREVDSSALLQGGARRAAARGDSSQIVADVSIADVPHERAQTMTQSLVVAVAQGTVKNLLTDRGISVESSLVVHKPTCSEETLQDAKAALEAALKEKEKLLKDSKEAKDASDDLLNADEDAHVKKIEGLEAEVAELKAEVASAPEKCDPAAGALPSLATTPEPKTPPTAKPPAPGTKVVDEVEVSKADAGSSAEEEESGIFGHVTAGLMIAVACIGISICFFLAAVRLIG